MDSDEEWENESSSWKGASGTVILVNAFDPLKTGILKESYQAICELVRGFLRTASSQHLGLCVYGIHTQNDLENAEDVIPLSVPSLNDFKKLQNTNFDSFTQSNELKMSDILWHTNKMFGNCKKLLSTKTVVLLTRMDIPPIEADQKPALKRVVDLVDSGIQLAIVNISEAPYHVDEFYEKFLTEANKGPDFVTPEPIWGADNILKMMQKHTHRHLAVARLNFEIGDGFVVGVGVYNFLQCSTKPKKIIADKETNQILTTNTKSYKVQTMPTNNDDLDNGGNGSEMEPDENEASEVPLLKSEILHYQIFGDERIELTEDEKVKLKNPFGPPTIKLLGFKPASILCKEKWYVKSCHFLYPNEGLIQGSTVAFKALHQACVETRVIAICVMCTRVNARPKIVGLLPTSKPFGFDISIGFDIIPIPFVENMRNVPAPEDCGKNIDEAHKVVMRDVVETLFFDYEPNMFKNPAVQSLHRAIEALALEEDEVQSFEDTTKRNVNELETIDSELFEDIFGPFGATAVKRPATCNSGKAVKKEKKNHEVDDELLNSRLSTNTVNKFTVAELLSILKSKDIPNLPALTGLKKQQLVDLVNENLN